MTHIALPLRNLQVAERAPTIAVAGNPNAGKSTLFNALTGLHQGVGNFPGTTVARREGSCLHRGRRLRVIDLPGAYSLSAGGADGAGAPDELIARAALTGGEPDVVLNVLDASNLERNLYLTLQLIETGLPVVVALNMVAEAQAQGIQIDLVRLRRLLGDRPIVAISARSGAGLPDLLDAVMEALQAAPQTRPPLVAYAPEIEAALGGLQATLVDRLPPSADPRHTALLLLEQDAETCAHVARLPGGAAVAAQAAAAAAEIAALYGDDVDILTADARYDLIHSIVRQVVTRSSAPRMALSARIDAVVTHRLIGLPLFAAVMYVVFKLVIDVSAPFLDWVDQVINGPLARWAQVGLTAVGAPPWLQALVGEGVIGGVGGVLVFVPGLLVLYFFLALLEDSGYLARAAFVMDRLMRVIGLHGKSVIPLVLGFGCAVPAVYATRTIAGRRDRLLTALLIPLMSCSARLPVYVVFGLAFFGRRADVVIWLLYLLGVLTAVAAGFVFSRTLLKPDGEAAFVLELPPYRLPSWRSLGLHMWHNTREFIRNAGTVILGMSLLLWLLLHVPWGVENPRDSAFGRVSQVVAPLFAPLGFGNWQATGALVTGVAAKEVVVSTLSQIYTGEALDGDADASGAATLGGDLALIGRGLWEALGSAGRRLAALLPGIAAPEEATTAAPALSLALRAAFTPASALAYLVFVLLYVPCVSTIAAIRQEFGARWAATSAVYQTAVAWTVALAVYQIGSRLGIGL